MEVKSCPRAKSDMTPCVIRDGDSAVFTKEDQKDYCIGCGIEKEKLSEKEEVNEE